MKLLPLVIVALLLPIRRAPAEDARPDPSALSELLAQCVNSGDPVAATATLVRFTGKPTRLQPPVFGSQSGVRTDLAFQINRYHADILREAGRFILEHPGAFPNGLPELSGLSHRERLGPLFASIVPYSGDRASLKTTLGPLEPLVSADWMDAAKSCGAVEFIHSIRACRGQLGQMLAEYQQAGDDVGIFRLGELLGLHPESGEPIQSEMFDSQTLALLLSAALGDPNRELDDLFPVMALAVRCEGAHPGLGDEISNSISRPQVRPWCRAVARFYAGQRKEALQQLCDLPTPYQAALSGPSPVPVSAVAVLRSHDLHVRSGVIGMLLSLPDCRVTEFPDLAASMPVEPLGGAVDFLLRYGNTDEEQLWRGVLLLAELLARKDLPEPLSKCLRFDRNDARRLHELFVRAGHDERARFFMEVAKPLSP